ncbi:UNVERIFIED_CONTAM: hypothetical protein RMT77_013426 [Armadillidium vulgare]
MSLNRGAYGSICIEWNCVKIPSVEVFKINEENDDLLTWKSRRRNSAFSPYRPVTILTNLQRGNIETTQTVQVMPDEFTFHSKAAMGELNVNDFTPDFYVDELDDNSLTPLMWAANYGQLPTVKLLIQKSANVNAEGEVGETPLLLASSGGHHEVCRLLLNSGANPNHIDHQGNTALMYAAHCDSAHCVSELIEFGADVSATNWENMSAYTIAVKKGSRKAQIVIEKHLLRLLEPS